jgi:glycosyltransferase involved in cell wall biosynthesis
MKLAIVIAAYNEERTIGATVKSVVPYGTPIVVNDGSKDKTSEIARQNGGHVVDQENRGYDGALDRGFAEAAKLGFTHVITFDADGQHPVEALPVYIEHLSKGIELVVGVRPKKQRVSELIFSFYTKLFFGISDPLCGMKGYKLDLYRSVGHFDSYHSTGTELMLRYLKAKKPTVQIPIDIKDREDHPRFGRLIRANLYILRSMLRGMFWI